MSAQDTSDITSLKQEALTLAAKPTKSFHAFALALWAEYQEDRSVLYDVERVAGIKLRALFYLLSVGALLNGYRIPEERAERIGWTKLRIVAQHVKSMEKVSPEDVEALLQTALTTTAHALTAALTLHDAAPAATTRAVLLRLSAEQYALVEAALIACHARKRGRGLVGKEEAITELARIHLQKAQ
ncbi:hypothetical protein [Sphingomonas quercus]|uniref:Uncharacterized protein n=1 Tax=Sphingomonas quercus TaxID=2842451 RepID=A0ABS6BKR3_9SPHN|nr:hypothetical protein [Sphingomonas quercus]MBU3077815.1 hypothetical protein [Sphingomonas quercus]